MDLQHWGLFFFAAFVINISPGPDLIFILSKAINHSAKIGISSSLGVATGALVHVVAASIGVSAVMASSELVFGVLKIFGAAFLIYLGVKQIVIRNAETEVESEALVTPGKAYKDGVLIDLLNPKVAIFFMAFLPQFTKDGEWPVSLQILALGLVVVVIGLAIEISVVLLISVTKKNIYRSEGFAGGVNKLFGVILIVIGIDLFLFQW